MQATAEPSQPFMQTPQPRASTDLPGVLLQSGVELPYDVTKPTSITESLDVIVQIERQPGIRFVSELLEIRGYDLSNDQYDFQELAPPTIPPVRGLATTQAHDQNGLDSIVRNI